MISLTINKHNSDQRLDRFLRKAFPAAPLSLIFAVLRKKKVRVNGVVGQPAQKLAESDLIQIYENLPQLPKIAPENKKGFEGIKSKLNFAMINADFAVINKPSGLPSQSGTGIKEEDSLAGMLGIWAREEGFDFKPALAHRLDIEASGLVIAALSGYAARELGNIIRQRKIRKEYLALVKGHIKKEGRVVAALPGDTKMSETSWVVKESFDECDLLGVGLETGRKHQIRLAFAQLGHPLLGDKRHGDFKFNREFKSKFGLSRLFLHAALLEFAWKGEKILIESPLPPELQNVINSL